MTLSAQVLDGRGVQCPSGDIQRDLQALRHMDGLHLALLDDEERAAFARLRTAGLAQVEYRGAAGFLGIGRLRLAPAA